MTEENRKEYPDITFDQAGLDRLLSAVLNEDDNSSLDDLKDNPFLNENDVKPNGLTFEDLKLEREQRAIHGFSRRDLWSANYHIGHVATMGFRELQKESNDPTYMRSLQELIDGFIAVNEIINTNTLSFFLDVHKNMREQRRWADKWLAELDVFRENIVDNWLSINKDATFLAWDVENIPKIMANLRATDVFVEAQSVVWDPITFGVPLVDRKMHFIERGIRGFSDWDLKNFRSYLVWLFVQAMVFQASKEATNFPNVSPWDTSIKWREYLLDTIEGLLFGEVYLFGSDIPSDVPADVLNGYMSVVSDIPFILQHLWN